LQAGLKPTAHRLGSSRNPAPAPKAGGGRKDWGPMTNKPVRRYTVDGKPMTPDDLRRLHDYLVDIEVIEVISDEMRIVIESEWPEFIHKLPPRR
jgi:hypothetical protein